MGKCIVTHSSVKRIIISEANDLSKKGKLVLLIFSCLIISFDKATKKVSTAMQNRKSESQLNKRNFAKIQSKMY